MAPSRSNQEKILNNNEKTNNKLNNIDEKISKAIKNKKKQNDIFETATQESSQEYDTSAVVSREAIDLSLNSIRIYFIEIAKNMYQIGLVCEIANLGQRAHLIKHVNFNGDAFDIVPRSPMHFIKAFLQEDIIKGQIIGDNFLAPNKNKFFKVMLPLKVEMVIDYQPPEIIFWGEWGINIENQLINLVSNFYGNCDKTISIEIWENLLKSVPDSNIDKISLKIPPSAFDSIDKYYNFMLFNRDRTAKINFYGFSQTHSVRSDNGVLVFLRGPSKPSLTGGWMILGQSYPEVWANPKSLSIYISVYPPDANGNPRPFGAFMGSFEEMGVIGSVPTTRGGDVLRFNRFRERNASDLTSPLQFINFRSTSATYIDHNGVLKISGSNP